VISAILQDVASCGRRHDLPADEQRFVMVAQPAYSGRWAATAARATARSPHHERCSFEGGRTGVKRRGFDLGQGRPDARCCRSSGRGRDRLEFAGAASAWKARASCAYTDVGEPWPTKWRPRHYARVIRRAAPPRGAANLKGSFPERAREPRQWSWRCRKPNPRPGGARC